MAGSDKRRAWGTPLNNDKGYEEGKSRGDGKSGGVSQLRKKRGREVMTGVNCLTMKASNSSQSFL